MPQVFQSLRASGRVVALGAILALLAMGALAGCSMGVPSVTIPSASSILDKAKNPGWKDATFNFTSKVQGASSLGPVTSSETGNGKLTTNPQRSDITFSGTTSVGSTQAPSSGEVITDGTTAYIKTAGQTMWTKLSSADVQNSAGGAAAGAGLTSLTNLKNIQFVGAETINGVGTWHVKGDTSGSASASGISGTVTGTVNLWVRQDNFYPVKIVVHQDVTSSQGNGTVDETVQFTSWDTGLTITPPPADQVQGA